MFKINQEHNQERLFSTAKNLSSTAKRVLKEHWSTLFFLHIFLKINEEEFAELYSDKFSRPNKPVNELVSLLIMKELFQWTDEETRDAYLFDFRVANAIGKEEIGQDTLAERTLRYFRQRLLVYEEETGIDLLKKVFRDIRDDLMEVFKISGGLQRIDTTFIEANIKRLTRLDLFVRVLHNFVRDLPKEERETLPEHIGAFHSDKKLNLSYKLKGKDVAAKLKELAEAILLLKTKYYHTPYRSLQSYSHLRRVLEEQCAIITEIQDEESVPPKEEDDDDDDRAWYPIKKLGLQSDDDRYDAEEGKLDTDTEEKSEETREDDTPQNNAEDDEYDGTGVPEIKCKSGADVPSDALQNPHDDEATYRRKRGEEHVGYKMSVSETCDPSNPFQVITSVDLYKNNTEDAELLRHNISDLAFATAVEDILLDGGFSDEEVESLLDSLDISLHYSGIRGVQVSDEKITVGMAFFDGHNMICCPCGYQPYEQSYSETNQRYYGRMAKSICDNCPMHANCFIDERQQYYSYGFYQRELIVNRRREKLKDKEYRKYVQRRAGIESTINQMTCRSGKGTRYCGVNRVKQSQILQGIGCNLKRVVAYARAQEKERRKKGSDFSSAVVAVSCPQKLLSVPFEASATAVAV